MNWVGGQTWVAFMDCFNVPRLLQRFFCDNNVFTPQTEFCAAQVVQTRKITHKSGQQCFFFYAPKSSSVVSDNIYCQQTFLAFFCKGSQGMKMPMPSRHHQNLRRLNFRLSSVYLQNHRPWKLNSSCNIVHSYHQFGGEFHLLQNLEYQSRQGSFKVERTSIFRYCNFSQPKLQPVSNFIFHSSTNDFKGFLHESFLQFPLFSLQNEGISSLCIYSWHSGSHTSPICDEFHTQPAKVLGSSRRFQRYPTSQMRFSRCLPLTVSCG